MAPQVLPIFHSERCAGCGLCVHVCRQGVFALAEGRAVFAAPDRCIYCGECELACPADAVELYFEIVSAPAAEASGGSKL